MNERITCLSYDKQNELLWSGLVTGRIQSHLPPSMNLYSAFCAHPLEVRDVSVLGSGILSLSQESLRFTSKGGIPLLTERLNGYTTMDYLPPNGEILIGGRNKNLIIYDLTNSTIIDELKVCEAGINQIKITPRVIGCARGDGKLTLMDPHSLNTIETLSINENGGINHFDLRGDILVTCGWSTR